MIATPCLICLIPLSADAAEHYLDRYEPVANWTLDQSPESKTLSDTTGQYKSLLIGQTDKRLPRQVAGARVFLSKAFHAGGWN